MQWIFWYDWALMPVYFLLLVTIVFRFGKKRYTGNQLKYFKYGFLAKLIGALGFAVYHQYIFGGGDTLLYFDTGSKITGFAFSDFHRFFSLVFSPVKDTVAYYPEALDEVMFKEGNFFAIRLTALLGLFTFKSYVAITLIFSTLSYIGIWYAYTGICKIYNTLSKELSIVFLFIPSVLLWGSGLGKDSLTLGATCLILGALLRLFLIPDQKKLKNIIYIFIGGFILILIKPYIIYSFILSFSMGILFQRIRQIKNPGLKLLFGPLLLIGGAALTYVAYQYIISDPNFGLDLIADKVVKTNRTLSEGTGAGSSYDLGLNLGIHSTFADILPIFPRGVFVTLFRPFLWEVSNIAMLMSALESFAFLIFFIYILLKNKILGIIPVFAKNPLAISCLLYTIIFAGLVGISSGNFGTLVRYKIPCIPFFGLMLVLANQKKIKTPPAVSAKSNA
jgi:hypothetical protein